MTYSVQLNAKMTCRHLTFSMSSVKRQLSVSLSVHRGHEHNRECRPVSAHSMVLCASPSASHLNEQMQIKSPR